MMLPLSLQVYWLIVKQVDLPRPQMQEPYHNQLDALMRSLSSPAFASSGTIS